ncbi:MAG: YARHG domain-containing protein [Lachnospiraceae bacterium]|nr:YARHG domain-containing protein [Lachnospiraceae bacterium]
MDDPADQAEQLAELLGLELPDDYEETEDTEAAELTEAASEADPQTGEAVAEEVIAAVAVETVTEEIIAGAETVEEPITVTEEAAAVDEAVEETVEETIEEAAEEITAAVGTVTEEAAADEKVTAEETEEETAAAEEELAAKEQEAWETAAAVGTATEKVSAEAETVTEETAAVDEAVEAAADETADEKKPSSGNLRMAIGVIVTAAVIIAAILLIKNCSGRQSDTDAAQPSEYVTSEEAEPTGESTATVDSTVGLPTTEAPTEPVTEEPTTEAPTEPVTEEPTTEAPTEPVTEEPTTEATTASGAKVPAKLQISGVSDDNYILPDSGTSKYSRSVIGGMSDRQLRYARNEICARAGRRYSSSSEYAAYFEQFDWYDPQYSGSYFDEHCDELINEYQKQNLDLINAEESARRR